jgi:hypothetical protein
LLKIFEKKEKNFAITISEESCGLPDQSCATKIKKTKLSATSIKKGSKPSGHATVQLKQYKNI